MKNMIQTEWWKLRRCQILLVGIVALALCPVVQYGTQLIVNPEIRDPNYDMLHLFSSVVWGNTQVFLPISLVMIGGWLIDRENTHDTMKNLLTVPVSYPKLLGGKLAVTGLRLVAVEQGRVIAAAKSGKVKTACTMVGIILMLIFPNATLRLVCVAVILVTTIYSGIEYFVKNKDVLAKGTM